MVENYTEHLNIKAFQDDLINWYYKVKRDLPWRINRDPYRILVSEIMLQQTQVVTVIPYYERFMKLFPTTKELAEADDQTLLKAWEGLGYYSRARNLRESARMIEEMGGFPTTHEEILKLKGVGPYTAGAVSSIAFGIPAPAVDGNVFRVMSRVCCIFEDIAKAKTRKIFEAVVSGVVFFSEYAGSQNPWVYSIVYNAPYIIASYIVSALLLTILYQGYSSQLVLKDSVNQTVKTI